ncbi:MAG: cyclic nucleotide-binding domain-containing protein [Acidobacteriota bacterium]
MKKEKTSPAVTAGGWAAFTDGGAAPRWVTAARVVMVIALAATIPAILGVEHGNRLVWTIAIAALPFFWMTAGYHVWRRICPLAVAGQLGRLLGRPGARKMGDWMGRHYLHVQLALMVACLSLRLVATNGSDVWLAGFLGAVVLAAIATSLVYGGKTWCNFVCPVGLVEKIHTEPARSAHGTGALTSQCAPCVACKKHCPDIDLEQGYWKEASEPSRRLAYFAWPGIVVGFYVYYYLVAGSWAYYFSGRWAYERDLPAKALDAGFTFLPAIPRVVAAPLTLVAFGAASYVVFAAIERGVLAVKKLDPARVRHVMLALAGLLAFNAFYCFAGQPSLDRLPAWVVTGWGIVVVFASTAIFARRVSRREDAYVHEKFAQKILQKWEWGDAPPSERLEDIYLLHTERTKQREARLRAYKETLREMVADGLLTRNELVLLDSLRAQLGISDKDHGKIVGELSGEERQLFDPAYHGSIEQRLARQQYRKELERIVVEAARAGTAPSAATLAALRSERGVGEPEEAAELARILAPGGPIAAIFDGELAEIRQLVAAAEVAHHPGDGSSESASLALLRHLAVRRARDHLAHAEGVLAVMGQPAAQQQAVAELAARLGRAGEAPLELAPLLANAGDSSRHLRAATAIAISRFEDEPARARLVALLDDPEPIVREAAVRAIGANSRLTRELLAKVLDDPDPRVRHAGVFAQTKGGGGTPTAYATLDANAAMASLTTVEKMMLLRQVPMFAELDAEDLEELAAVVEEKHVDAGTELFREGETGDAVYLIVRGRVRVLVAAGGAEKTIDDLGPGSCIGEMAVLDASPRSATVRALERTRALRVPAEGFRRVLADRPEMSQVIVVDLVRRLRGMMAQAARDE